MGRKLGVLILSAAAMSVSFSGQADAVRYQVYILSDDLSNREIVLEVVENSVEAPEPDATPEPESTPDESTSGGGQGTSNCDNGHGNNGHGNNLDGVDSSNPGKGKGGPNGAVDESGDVDDEAGTGNGKKK